MEFFRWQTITNTTDIMADFGLLHGRFKMAYNALRLCDGRIENLIINRDVSAAIAKPLLAAGLSHKLK